jgi:DNA-directed RNA polymerase specialized sigma24 family protein
VPTDKSSHLAASLVHSQSGKLRRFFAFRVHNRADIPDLTQEVFLRMLRIPDQEVVRSPEAYLFTVALHVAQQHAMRNSAIPPSAQVDELPAQLPASPDTDPLLQAHGEQCLDALTRALESLAPKVHATTAHGPMCSI